MKKAELKNETIDSTKQLGNILQVGSFVEFYGMAMTIYGCICRINNNNTVDYVRESLTRWTVDARMIKKGNLITEENFIRRVKMNAKEYGSKIPTTDEVKASLDLFKSNFDADKSEILKALNIS